MNVGGLKVKEFPKISIVIPVYNAISTIDLCLESILNLNYPNNKFEIIVVDNGSDDGSDEVVKKHNVKLFYETLLKSSYQARNKGIVNSNGELIVFTDSDCIATPNWLTNLVKDWHDTSIGCYAGEVLAYKPHTLVEKYSDRKQMISNKLALKCEYMPYTVTANTSYRKEVFERIGLFNPRLFSGGDNDFSWRMQKKTDLQIKYEPDAIVYHKHRTNLLGLYRQYKRYEYGDSLLQEYHSNHPILTIKQMKYNLLNSSYRIIRWLPIGIIKYLKNDIDTTTLISPFFDFIIDFATYRGRLSYMKDHQLNDLLPRS